MHSLKRILALFVLCYLCWQIQAQQQNAVAFDYDTEEATQDVDDESTSDRSLTLKPISYSPLTSGYQVLPGSYSSPYPNKYYNSGKPYSVKSIFSDYLTKGPYLYNSPGCKPYYGVKPNITGADVLQAFVYANSQMPYRYPQYLNTTIYQKTAHKEVEGKMMELASEYFAKFKCFSKYQLGTYLSAIPLGNQYYYMSKQGDRSCLPFYNEKYKCSPYSTSKYRTIDGSCNNLRSPFWGRSLTCHIRLLPADYSDGIQAFRMAKTGRPLPNPRTISNYVALSKELKSFYTTLILVWGQFINHDITLTEAFKANLPNQTKIDCCQRADDRCMAIPLDNPNDYIATMYKKKCLNIMRSSPCPLCKLGPREHLNKQTSFLDGSMVYGATIEESNQLRSFMKGQLLAQRNVKGNSILPSDPQATPCSPLKRGLTCFKAGDIRVNQHPLLLAIHTLLMRSHNYHAYQLSFINPSWNDEKLFQEARRITIAEIQHITFNEYLPVILGPLLMHYYKLYPKKEGYSYYESFTDPSSWNEFVAAASRYGHSHIKDYYFTRAANYKNMQPIPLKDNFFEPGFAWDGLLDEVVRGTVTELSNTIDPYYSNTAKNFIMRNKNESHGIDLVTTNIQRGRDHGLPGYIHYLKACFNYEAKTWKDLAKFIPNEPLTKLKLIYGNVEDIDLYIAGVSERHFIDASIGPTFGCLVGIQFYHLKFGDRYFYEHGKQSGSFTPAQLKNIKQITMARLLCRTLPGLTKIQPLPFYLSSRYNKPINCRSYSEIDYRLWKDV